MEKKDRKGESMREAMPHCAAFVDFLREALGREIIDAQIRKGLRGECAFWLREGAHEIGAAPDTTGQIAVPFDPRAPIHPAPASRKRRRA